LPEHTLHRGSDSAPAPRASQPSYGRSTWRDAASCSSRTNLMYDHARRAEARALCAGCPVAAVCLWSAMAVEVDEPYRYGRAGGLGPLQRRRLAERVDRAGVDEQLARALALWASKPDLAPARTPWRPPPPAYRPWRKCRGCKAVIRQPRAGRPQLWCSPRCYQRATRDRIADAARNRGRWAELAETARDKRRAAMRARWAALSPNERAELAARRRQRRQRARLAS
jgi:hypothetical protein